MNELHVGAYVLIILSFSEFKFWWKCWIMLFHKSFWTKNPAKKLNVSLFKIFRKKTSTPTMMIDLKSLIHHPKLHTKLYSNKSKKLWIITSNHLHKSPHKNHLSDGIECEFVSIFNLSNDGKKNFFLLAKRLQYSW